jgi:aryl-alcohol dehydrogenase (NADP+)
MLTLAEWKGYAKPVAMQNLYNLVQREEEREMIPLCRARGVALTPYSPNARGFLAANRAGAGGATDRAQKDAIAQKQDRRACDLAIVDELAAIATAHGVKPVQIALAWLWAKGVVAPVMGATRLEYLDEAAGAVDIKLSPEEIARLEAPYLYRGTPPL